MRSLQIEHVRVWAIGGLPAGNVSFDSIAQKNCSLSLVELSRFALFMFPKEHNTFTWNELSWVVTKAKVEPISANNWHGDADGDSQQVCSQQLFLFMNLIL